MSILVSVRSGNGELAIKQLKRKMQRELCFRNMKQSRYYESPSEAKVRKDKESRQRVKLAMRKRHRGEDNVIRHTLLEFRYIYFNTISFTQYNLVFFNIEEYQGNHP